jgi:hypothetical protein
MDEYSVLKGHQSLDVGRPWWMTVMCLGRSGKLIDQQPVARQKGTTVTITGEAARMTVRPVYG